MLSGCPALASNLLDRNAGEGRQVPMIGLVTLLNLGKKDVTIRGVIKAINKEVYLIKDINIKPKPQKLE